MSLADNIFIDMCKDVIENGTSTEGEKVRPVWEDGTPAYTIKRFGVVNRYDLRKEFPALTLRRTALKSAMDEILWIWQQKSNNIHDLHSHIWDSWADENGSIGKAYGYQLGVKHQYKEGMMDQVDRVLFDLKNNPYSRRIMTNINTQKMALKMAVPGGIKSLIKPVDEAIRILNNPKASKMRILVLTRTVKDALKVRQSVGEIGFLNVGNTGRFDGIDVSEKLVLTPTIMLTKEEQQALKDLVALDPKTCMQQVPNDEQKLVKDVLDKLS